MSIKIYVKYVKNNRDFYTTKMNLPTGNLDEENEKIVFSYLKKLAEQGHTVIAVSHNEAVKDYADEIVEM